MFVRYLVGIYVYIWIIIKYYGKLVKKNSVLCPILLNRRFSNGSQFFDIHKYLWKPNLYEDIVFHFLFQQHTT